MLNIENKKIYDLTVNACLVISMILFLNVYNTEGWGKSCLSSERCRIGEICESGRCQCNQLSEPYYEGTEKKCNWTYGITELEASCNACAKDQDCTVYGYCQCKSNLTALVDKTCLPVTWIPPRGKCNITDGKAFLCNESIYSKCSKGVCSCPSKYLCGKYSKNDDPEKTIEIELQQAEAAVGSNCSTEVPCIEGLLCSNSTCKCPPPCESLRDNKTCDCGEFHLREFPKRQYSTGEIVPVAFVGVILSLASIFFWGACIKRILKRERASNSSTYGVPMEPVQPVNPPSNRQSPVPYNLPSPQTYVPPSAPPEPAGDVPPAYDDVVTNPPSFDAAKNQKNLVKSK